MKTCWSEISNHSFESSCTGLAIIPSDGGGCFSVGGAALGSLVFSKSFFTCSSNMSSSNDLPQQDPQHPALLFLLPQQPSAPYVAGESVSTLATSMKVLASSAHLCCKSFQRSRHSISLNHLLLEHNALSMISLTHHSSQTSLLQLLPLEN